MKVSYVDLRASPIPRLSSEQYQKLVKHFTKDGSNDNTTLTVNMDGKVDINDA